MKITTNVIGNYNPYTVNRAANVNRSSQVASAQQTAKVTNEEKDFFKKLYPENKKEIVDYHFYQNSGKMNGVSVGTLFDKRG
ncbi:MAG: hypothetical protein ACEPO8_13625 [Rhodothermaceae bacterium]